jgi:hypothetical protein
MTATPSFPWERPLAAIPPAHFGTASRRDAAPTGVRHNRAPPCEVPAAMTQGRGDRLWLQRGLLAADCRSHRHGDPA